MTSSLPRPFHLMVLTLAAFLAAGILLIWSGERPAEAQGGDTVLRPQWNLVTAPRAGSGQQLGGTLANVQSIHRWNNVSKVFESWRRGAPDFIQTLEQAEVGEGLWVEVTGSVNWGLPPLGENLPPTGVEGFHMIGWVETDTAAEDALRRLHGDRIVGWNAATQQFESLDPSLPPLLNTLDVVERGHAYWVFFSAATLPPVELELVGNATQPVDIVPLSGGELLVVEQAGMVQRLQLSSGTLGTPLLDIRDRVGSGGDRGLLSVALDPNFGANGLIYAWYWVAGQDRMRLSRFTTIAGSFVQGSELIILQVDQPFSNHNGGRIVFGPDGFLYLGIGDGGSQNDPQGNGQNLGNLLGTIIRIDVDGASTQTAYFIPDDNPFVGQDPGGEIARAEIYAYGLRNPWRMSFDRQTGDLWVGDVGQDAFEEVNIVTAGGNYGWSLFDGNECFNSDTCDSNGLISPVALYTHDGGRCSISGGAVYRGRAYEALQGTYIFADFCSGEILGTPAAAPGGVQVINAGIASPVAVSQDISGELYVVSSDGGIYKVVEP